jgi:hypothetical protein
MPFSFKYAAIALQPKLLSIDRRYISLTTSASSSLTTILPIFFPLRFTSALGIIVYPKGTEFAFATFGISILQLTR